MKLEELECPNGFLGLSFDDENLRIEDVSPDDIHGHIEMLFDAGYIASGTDVRGPLDGSYYFKSLTWEGRDFLDSVRDPETWRKTKGAASKAGGWTTQILAEIAKALIKGELHKLGLPIG